MNAEEPFLEELKQGAPAAYAVLVERYEGPLYRFFLCDHRDHHVAQEQTAETFVQLVRSLRAMRGGVAQLSAYVFATARHVQLRRYRQHGRRAAALSEAAHVCDRQPLPETVASDREQLDRVLQVISRLDDPMRNVLVLRFVEGLSIDEVAAALELPTGTVKSHIHRSRTRLKQLFAEQEFEA